MLEDICYPSEIVGKRIRHKLDGSQIIKVHLDKSQQTVVDHKVNNIIKYVLAKGKHLIFGIFNYHFRLRPLLLCTRDSQARKSSLNSLSMSYKLQIRDMAIKY